MMTMKLFSISRTILFLLVGLGNITPLAAQNLLSAPECAVYDQEHHRYLVSCYGSGAIINVEDLSFSVLILNVMIGTNIYRKLVVNSMRLN